MRYGAGDGISYTARERAGIAEQTKRARAAEETEARKASKAARNYEKPPHEAAHARSPCPSPKPRAWLRLARNRAARRPS